MGEEQPVWLDPALWLKKSQEATSADVKRVLGLDSHGVAELSVLLSGSADDYLEAMAQKAQQITRRHFGRTVSLYVPLYVSNYCPGGCAYCGFASDRDQVRTMLSDSELDKELRALSEQGFNDILLLTGEKTKEASFDYLLHCVEEAAKSFHSVSVESFSMTEDEYAQLVAAGCTGVTLYQETYNAALYDELHRWGSKKDYMFRLEAPSRAMDAGMRMLGLGVLLGLDDPVREGISLYLHAERLLKKHWKSGVMISFPRICEQEGGYKPAFPVNDRMLARLIFALRICLPDVPLVLSTREGEKLRDGFAGVGINRMSVASRTTVGGYGAQEHGSGAQFEVTDKRDVQAFCESLKQRGLEPVFKNWDSVFQHQPLMHANGR
ncbi:thiamine biosynthesis protein ThiH [bacterium E08(2017)]|nr:thiamine biosynthesis protein ThiH [bacterium E08(2017)]